MESFASGQWCMASTRASQSLRWRMRHLLQNISSLSSSFLCSSSGQVSQRVGTYGYLAEGIPNRQKTCVRSSYLSVPDQDLISAAVMLC